MSYRTTVLAQVLGGLDAKEFARCAARHPMRRVPSANSLTGDDLANILDVDRSVAYRILKGERGLTTAHVKALRNRFGVSADIFV